MDESVSKALIMVASVLLAMIVIAFMVYTFNQMGAWQTTQDEETLTEQIAEFNKEYEAYDKSLMYGVDVISCLNKSLSNNEKITNESVINGETYDATYEVQVHVTLNSILEESITVYYMTSSGKELSYSNGDGPANNIKLENTAFSFLTVDYYDIASSFSKNDYKYLKTYEGVDCKISETYFELTQDETGQNETSLRALLSVSSTLSETIKNTDTATKSASDGWTKAEFRSALYDMKTRKFNCTNIEYDTNTGRIKLIEFKEI